MIGKGQHQAAALHFITYGNRASKPCGASGDCRCPPFYYGNRRDPVSAFFSSRRWVGRKAGEKSRHVPAFIPSSAP
ncbi:MAG: hypothetical protein C6P37_01275 [Caldibacillus debilis]|uniref:Uncharacterized protein n=1 Tax=Caldibacillus debilis TaxID=301148 RepID=A0A3E0K8X9_9BACI|nr:MAG: hypothetical protein C6P37_01275 [Caldibacillus debilis]